MRHAVGQREVGEVVEAEQARLLAAQSEDAADVLPVVELARGRARRVGAPDLLANGGVVEVSHDGGVAGSLQREAPAGQALLLGALAGGGDGAGGRPASLASSVMTSSKALVESSTFWAKRVVSLLSSTSISASRFLPAASSSAPWRRKSSRVLVRKRRRTPSRAAASSCAGVLPDRLPQACVQGNARVELAGDGLHGVVGSPQFRVRGHPFQVPDQAHGVIQAFGERVQFQERVLERARAVVLGQRLAPRLGAADQRLDGRHDMFGADPVERNPELDLE